MIQIVNFSSVFRREILKVLQGRETQRLHWFRGAMQQLIPVILQIHIPATVVNSILANRQTVFY